MNRRAALTTLTVLSGSALVLMTGVWESCNHPPAKRTSLTGKDVPLLNEIGEAIIPATLTSPGAKQAGVGDYMLLMVNDCFSNERRKLFIEGLNTFDEICRHQHQNLFINLSAELKKKFLQQLNKETQLTRKDEEHYFSMLKSLTINGYISSKEGVTKAFRYDPVPGKFEGCHPYEKGDKPWSAT